MTHEEIKILISAYIDGELTPSEKNIVEEHLSTCPACQKDCQTYRAISSSLSKWSDESLSPDESIKMQKRFEQRREPMFTKRTLITLGTTLAITLIIGSVVTKIIPGHLQARLRSASDDLGDQYSASYIARPHPQHIMVMAQKAQYQPYYMQNNYNAAIELEQNKRLASGAMAGNMAATMIVPAQAISAGGFAAPTYRSFPPNPSYPVYAKEPFNNEHKVIKNANMTLKVEDAQKAQTQLDRLVTKYNGIIINFQINRSDDGSRTGVLAFNVLPKDLKNILSEIRKLGEIQLENQSGVDITNQYEYLHARLENYQTVRDRLKKVLKKNANNVDDNLSVENEITNVDANIDAIENSIRSLDDQSYMATVVVNFYDEAPKIVVKEPAFKDKLTATFKDSFKSTLQTSYEIGINSFSGLIIVLSFLFQVAIWALIFWGVYLIVNMIIKK